MTKTWLHRLALLSAVILSHSAVLAQRSPEEQVKTLRVPADCEISLFASEPMITNPSAIDIDTHGRVWVAEIQWYRAKAKQPPADSIKVLEDTDGNGMADKVTVFADGVFAPMSICVAGDKVYVATSPDLWVYEDKDGDLRADGPPKKLLTGFGGLNHDHGAHSLVLGPDHKWWMAHGDTGFNVRGTDGSHIEYRWGAMLRGELDGSKLETVAVNFRNPYELCVSSFGECYFSDNDNDGNESVRAGWVLEGGNYGWFGGPPGPKGHVPAEIPFSQHWHFRGHIPGHVPATLVTGFGSPCGICFYEGDAFGPKFKNVPLHCDAGPREVRSYRHQLAGYGMKAVNQTLIYTEGDDYFRPDDICAAPDGSLFIADWYDGGVGGHAYNDPDRGRIFRLAPKNKQLERIGKPGPYRHVEDALQALRSPNLATQYLAREFLLKQGESSIAALEQLHRSDADENVRARALWLLDRIGAGGRAYVVRQLKNESAAHRALAARILRRRCPEYSKELLGLASDTSHEVRRELLLALPRIAQADRIAALDTLAQLAATYDGTDRYQLEAIIVGAADLKTELFARLDHRARWSAAKLPLMALLEPKAAGKFLDDSLNPDGHRADLAALLDTAAIMQSTEAARSVLKFASNQKVPDDLRQLALKKLDLGLAFAWKSLAAEPEFTQAMQQLLASRNLADQVMELAGKHSITAIGPDLVRLALSREIPTATRRKAIAVVSQLKPQNFTESISALLNDEDATIRELALNTLVDMQDMKTLRAVLAGNRYPAAVQVRTIERLMAGTGGALVLLRMLDANSLAPSLAGEVTARAAKHPDSSVRTLYEKHIPAADRPRKLGEAVKPDEILAMAGDAKRGELIFFQSSAAQCKSCHTVHGKGAALGPDLSQIGKKYERATLLETILQPSKAIAPEFYTYLVETDRGQVFAGLMIERSDKQVILKDAKGDLIRIASPEIVEMVKMEKSVMPDLVLRDVTAQDAADLLAFLTTLNQGSQTVSTFRVVGPFNNGPRDLDAVAEPERAPGQPDHDAEFQTFGGKKIRWEVVAAESTAGFPAVDTVKFDSSRALRTTAVTHYLLVYAESPAEQQATLLIGSDDGCKVWVNGELVHRNEATRALSFGSDRVPVQFRAGRNVILMKVINGDGAGGFSLGVNSASPVQFRVD